MANYEVVTQNNAVPIKAWTQGVPFEYAARQQAMKVAMLPFVHKWVAIMPDVHSGKGATIGSVIPTDKAVIPAAVGVDIGCGMMAAKISLNANDLPDSLGHIRAAIEKAVPHGRSHHGGRNDRGAWGKIPGRVDKAWATLADEFAVISDKHPVVARANHVNHLGTLGTGNHFIEVCLDENDAV